MPHTRCSLLALAVLLLGASLQGQEPIRFGRTPDISPDGKVVAFNYLGDIWTVETIGGVARPVTMHQAHDLYPVFSPDGRQLAFSSNRHGSYDIFVVSSQGGKPRRLTFDSAADYVCGWSPDGKQVLFSSNRSAGFPPTFELYTVPCEGGQERRLSVNEGREGVLSPRGDLIAYVRGPGTWYRKGYKGSSNDDLWICNADGSNNRQLTQNQTQDSSPMWSPDGKTLYYVSEAFGSPANIVKQDAGGMKTAQLVTFHKDDAVRKARISGGGDWIVYECGADLWVVSTREGYPPRKLAIEVNADDKANTERTVTLTNGATEFALSPDEDHVVFSVRGELFLVARSASGKPVRLTNSPAYDHGVAWAPDGSKLIFVSDRSGHEDLYLLESAEAGKKITQTTQFKTKQLTDTADAEFGVQFMPDGKKVGYVRAGRLWTMNPDGTEQKTLISTPQIIDYEWSPDGKWVAFARLDGSFASEVYIMPTAGGDAKNITRHATFNAGITWSSKGMKLAFLSDRRQGTSMYAISLQKPAAPDAPSSSDIDWDDIHLRAEQVAPISADQGAVSHDGTKVAFRSSGGSSGSDLWVANTNGRGFNRITTGGLRPQNITWSKRNSDVVYFLDGTGQVRLARTAGSAFGGTTGSTGSDSVVLPFSVKMSVRQDEEFTEMFDQSWRALSDNFYDAKFHGVDWSALRNKYRPLVKHCALKEDLYALISLLLGELNASHLGISGFATTPEEVTADLGLLLDESYRGPGLKVNEILKRGPADKRGLALKPGDLIVAIDGTDLTDKVNLSKLLGDKVNEIVSLQVVPAGADPKDPKNRKKVDLQAVSRQKTSELMYDRWVAKNTERVSELSKGKLGYIHIPSMDEAGLDRFVRALYSDNHDKDAIVLDVRFNGGGFTHDQVLNYLGAREHTVFRQRDGGEGLVLRSYDRKWHKPTVLLINNRSYSDAEIFPSAFKTLGLGKLVGQPTGGFVIGTSSLRLIDGSQFRIPRTGVFTLKGVNMEKEGVQPDVLVETHPDQIAKGVDAQLEKAVEVLQKDVITWKEKQQPAVVVKPDAGKPAVTPQTSGPTVPPGK